MIRKHDRTLVFFIRQLNNATYLRYDIFEVLIPSLYTTSLYARSLRSVRVPSNQNPMWQFSFPPFIDKKQEFLVFPYLLDTLREWTITMTPHRCDNCYRSNYISSQGAPNCSISVVHNYLYQKNK